MAEALILGGGLAGLVAAHQLHCAGIAFELIEARDRLGGRILSAGADGLPSADGFDLGPSWFWPGMHPGMARLIDDLGLEAFAQFSEGALLFQRSRSTPPEGSVAKIVKLEHAWRRLDGRNDDGFQVAPFPG